ncbi:MAG: hypothetical protein JSV16_11940, partial [Candidatus Hydrogenedentota bacterium]
VYTIPIHVPTGRPTLTVNGVVVRPVDPAPILVSHIPGLICHGQWGVEMVVVVEMKNFLCQCCRYARRKQEDADEEGTH